MEDLLGDHRCKSSLVLTIHNFGVPNFDPYPTRVILASDFGGGYWQVEDEGIEFPWPSQVTQDLQTSALDYLGPIGTHKKPVGDVKMRCTFRSSN